MYIALLVFKKQYIFTEYIVRIFIPLLETIDMLVQICSCVYHSRFQGVIPPEPQGRAGVEGDHGDGCSHPGPPAYRILRPASQAQEESTPELEILPTNVRRR